MAIRSAQVDEEYSLGDFVASYHFSTLRFLISVAFLMAYGLGFLWLVVVISQDEGFRWLYLIIVALGGWAVVYALMLIGEAVFYNLGTVVRIYQEGLAYQRRSEFYVVKWNEIETIWVSISEMQVENILPLLLQYTIHVRCTDGREFTIRKQIRKVKELGNHIIGMIQPRLVTEALKRIERGEELDFGDYRIGKRGLTIGGDAIPWEKLSSIGVSQNDLQVMVKGNRLFNIKEAFRAGLKGGRLARTPNAFVLIELANCLKERSEASMSRTF